MNILIRLSLLAFGFLLAAGGRAQGLKKEPVDYASPLVGTMSKFALSHGNTYPAIARPWGMNFWTPHTSNMRNGWAYGYTDDQIKGFKQTHQPSPWMNDYGQFSIMPMTREATLDQDQRGSWFSHKAEIAKPYYYRVYLSDHDVVTELTPTDRACLFRFTFPERETSYVAIDTIGDTRGTYIKIIPGENKVIGYTTTNSGGIPANFKNYFVIVFDRPFDYTATVSDDKLNTSGQEERSQHAGAIVGFKTKRGDIVHARVASSFISPEQAEINLKELGVKSFEQLLAEGREEWNKVLGRIVVEDDNIDNLRTFYSCLYRSVLFPRKFYEIDNMGKAVHYSPYNGKVLPGYMFTDTGFWDTFRCLFPFLNLVYPSMSEQMQEGLVNAYLESGFLPEWASPGQRGCMIGNNSASVVADAYLKGLKNYDAETLWKAVVHGANAQLNGTDAGRRGYEEYNQYGYVPNEIEKSAARTLEYAYDDWCIYQFGKALGRPESETRIFAERAMNYRNVFDKETGFMRGKDQNGKFREPFNPADWSRDFVEGNSWHWTWSVFHDPKGLIELMGGKEAFNAKLDAVFAAPLAYKKDMIHEEREMRVMNMGQYAHGNQPIQHMIYLYGYAGQPWKGQYWVREVMDKLYDATPNGYCGDEDNGQTSAWYVFSAMGFYPVCPGANQYVLGSPLFQQVTLRLENGKQVVISAKNNNERTRYIKTLLLGGRPYTKNYVAYDDLLKGARLDFEMSAEPNKQRGVNEDDFPYSFSNEFQGSKK